MKFQLTLIISFLFLLSNCQRLPQKKFSQATQKKFNVEVLNDSLKIEMSNSISCPIRVFASSSSEDIQAKIAKTFPVVLPANSDTLISYWTDKTKEKPPIKFKLIMGNPNDIIYKRAINLPFKKSSKYKIIQGYNGSFSHNSEYSKYAIDFNLMEGDTVCAAADGFVVGVIEGYTRGGRLKKWRDYANFITVFHQEMNIYTQYVHLMHQGSLVEVGDYVKSEQAIGLSGKTGRTDVEHLHFNVLVPTESWMESTQIKFVEGYRGVDLKKGDWVEK